MADANSRKTRHLFLDLEDTIINPIGCGGSGWYTTSLREDGVRKIRSFIAEWSPNQIHIFSFAIWNQEELDGFNLGTRPMIEAALGRPISAVPTVQDMIHVMKKSMNVTVLEQDDLLHFLGKQFTFRECLHNRAQGIKNHGLPGIDVVLLDDVVYNESFDWPDKRISGRILNILEMKDPHGNDADQDPAA